MASTIALGKTRISGVITEVFVWESSSHLGKKSVFAGHICFMQRYLYTVSELNTEKEGCMSYTAPEDAQRPSAVYDIHPDFRRI